MSNTDGVPQNVLDDAVRETLSRKFTTSSKNCVDFLHKKASSNRACILETRGATVGQIAEFFVRLSTNDGAGVPSSILEQAIRVVTARKGLPWSETEYNCEFSTEISKLGELGATELQLAEFRKRTDEAPIKGGRFNSYSGD